MQHKYFPKSCLFQNIVFKGLQIDSITDIPSKHLVDKNYTAVFYITVTPLLDSIEAHPLGTKLLDKYCR